MDDKQQLVGQLTKKETFTYGTGKTIGVDWDDLYLIGRASCDLTNKVMTLEEPPPRRAVYAGDAKSEANRQKRE